MPTAIHELHAHLPIVALAALAAFIAGAVWYTALFGALWTRLQDYTPEQLARARSRSMPAFFLGMYASYFVAAVNLALLIPALDAHTAGAGAVIGLCVWAIVAAFRMTAHLASPRPLAAYLIDAGFDLVALTGMGAIIGALH